MINHDQDKIKVGNTYVPIEKTTMKNIMGEHNRSYGDWPVMQTTNTDKYVLLLPKDFLQKENISEDDIQNVKFVLNEPSNDGTGFESMLNTTEYMIVPLGKDYKK